MKTIIRISNGNNYAGISDQIKEDNINYLVNNLNVCCEIANNDYRNMVEELKEYTSDPDEYKNKIEITATGYVQSEWQRFTLHHSHKSDDPLLLQLVDTLKKHFTHRNDYHVEKFERATIKGKTFDAEPHDLAWFGITHIEFPEEEDIIEAYQEIYGKDYDEVEFEI